MDWTLLFLGLAPIGLVAATMSENNTILDYGGLGLAAVVVFFLCRYLTGITKQHREERRELVASLHQKNEELKVIIKDDTRSRERLTEALENRPCLARDPRIRGAPI